MKRYRSSSQQRSLMMNERTEETSSESCCAKSGTPRKMADRRFTNVCSVEQHTFKQEKTAKKTERDLRFLKRFFKTYDEDRII